MIGAVIGDFIGSYYEVNNSKRKDNPLVVYTKNNKIVNRFTDDSVMTVAVADVVSKYLENDNMSQDDMIKIVQKYGREYINAGYGGMFLTWLISAAPKPYNSFGNGALMRVSPVALCYKLSLTEKHGLAKQVTEITHNHPSALKSVECYVNIINHLMYSRSDSKEAINDYCRSEFKCYYNSELCELDKLRPSYEFDVTCDGTLPVAIEAFIEANSYMETIQNAISMGGDSDTIAAIAGAIAEAYYGPKKVLEEAHSTKVGKRSIEDCLIEVDPKFAEKAYEFDIALVR